MKQVSPRRLSGCFMGKAQFDLEIAEAFRERWTMPRRRKLRMVIEEPMRQGDFRKDIDPELATDTLYAPIYCRLQIGSGPLSESFVNSLLDQARKGLGP